MTVAMLSLLVVFHEIQHELLISFSLVFEIQHCLWYYRFFPVFSFFFFSFFFFADAFAFMYSYIEEFAFNYTFPFFLILPFIIIDLFVVAIILSSTGCGLN